MTCIPFRSNDGKTSGFVCTRGPRVKLTKCATCGLPGGKLCDGCDQPLCDSCAVSPAAEQDFCPACFEPVWRQFLASHHEMRDATRERRRRVFRSFARMMPQAFDCIPRTAEGQKAREEHAP